MTAMERRTHILRRLQESDSPVSAALLARELSVTRQVIVGDVALLRAQGHNIAATPRGYIIPLPIGITRQIACCHASEETREELYIMVDCGCTVLDVVVEHPVYGQLTAPLQISSRYDVDQYLERMRQCDATPLSLLTDGIHLHTIACPSNEVWLHLNELLQQRGFLLTEQEN